MQRLFLWIKQLGFAAISKLRERPHGSVLRDANEKRNEARIAALSCITADCALRFPGRQEHKQKGSGRC